MVASRGGSMDQENAALQQRLHDANQERMRGIEEEQRRFRDEQSQQALTLARIEENTKGLPELRTRVETLEGDRNKAKGAMWAVGALQAAGLTFADWFLHHRG